MSTHMNKPKSRLTKSAERKNEILVTQIINGKETTFARVEANLGPQFRIAVFDQARKQVIKVFGISRKSKKEMAININDIVLLSSLPKEGHVGEIIGRLCAAGSNDARPLLTQGRIHREIFSPIQISGEVEPEALDDIFEDNEVNPDDI